MDSPKVNNVKEDIKPHQTHAKNYVDAHGGSNEYNFNRCTFSHFIHQPENRKSP